MEKPHFFQMQILRELLFTPQSRFTDLNISGLTSDHFTYYIKGLVKQNLVIKGEKGKYSLTERGKEMANTMDTDQLIIEKQPKVAVFLIVEKLTKDKSLILIQTRKKEPYYGHSGFITGKSTFGETIYESAKRELLEETGLNTEFELRCVLREHIYSKTTKSLLEDKVFFIMKGYNPKGKLTDFKGGDNHWITREEFSKLEKKFYAEEHMLDLSDNPPQSFYLEETYHIDEF